MVRRNPKVSQVLKRVWKLKLSKLLDYYTRTSHVGSAWLCASVQYWAHRNKRVKPDESFGCDLYAALNSAYPEVFDFRKSPYWTRVDDSKPMFITQWVSSSAVECHAEVEKFKHGLYSIYKFRGSLLRTVIATYGDREIEIPYTIYTAAHE